MTTLLGSLIRAYPPPNVPLRFAPRAVGDDEVKALLAAARVAPSADNFQTWRFVEVRDGARRAAVGAAARDELTETIANAAVVIVACGTKALVTKLRTEQPFVWLDVPIAWAQLLLAAAEIGLACAWSFELDEPLVRRSLGIPEDVRVIALAAIGWPLGGQPEVQC